MNLEKKELEELRVKYIKKIIKIETAKKGWTQPELAEKIGKNHNTIKPYIWGPRTPKTDEIYDLIFKEAFGFDDKKISEIKAEAREQQIKAEFGSEIGIKTDTAEKEEVPFKVAFKREFGKDLTEKDKEILDRLFKENGM